VSWNDGTSGPLTAGTLARDADHVREGVRRVGVAGAGVVLLASAITAVGFSRANEAAVDVEPSASGVALVVGFLSLPAVGVALLWLRQGQPVARLLVASGLLMTLSQTANGWAFYALSSHPGSLPGGRAAAWFATWAVVPALGLGPFILLVFPDGQVRRRWLRRYAGCAAAALVLITVAQAVAPDELDGGPAGLRPISNPLGVEALRGTVSVVTGACALVLVGLLVLAAADLVLRYRSATGDEKQQLRWVAAAASILPVTGVVALFLQGIGHEPVADVVFATGQLLLLFGLSSAIAVAVLRHRLYDLDLVLSRSLLYAALSGLVALGYVAVVALVGAVVRGAGGVTASLVAAGAVALAFQPAHVRLRRAADRIVRGTSGEPYAALAGLGTRLADAIDPAEVPQVLVDAVVRELRVPYAALVQDGLVLAEAGTRTSAADELEVAHRGEQVATLVVGARPGRAPRPAERRLLHDLAQQAGAALRVTSLTAEVQRAREDLVAGREEERRRLRHELHDGVGPALAGLALQAGALRQQLDSDAPAVRRLEEGLAHALAEVRRTARDLRPQGLDELGLRGALEQLTSSFCSPALTVELAVPDGIDALPAATEVAVLRIAGEALSNVARHSGAAHCWVRVDVTGRVVVEVRDDGAGFDGATDGVGLVSMRRRAEELGGSLHVVSSPDGGTVVRADLGRPT
jgi:signal transduction histidine kinase